MTSPCFVLSSTFTGAAVLPQIAARNACPSARPAQRSTPFAGDSKPPAKRPGLFDRIKETIFKPLVAVPGGGDDLLECVFCTGTGFCDCDACRGTGKDSLGTCFMCDGKTNIKCTVCSGVGMVDRVRRGGTDDKNTYVVRKKKY